MFTAVFDGKQGRIGRNKPRSVSFNLSLQVLSSLLLDRWSPLHHKTPLFAYGIIKFHGILEHLHACARLRCLKRIAFTLSCVQSRVPCLNFT